LIEFFSNLFEPIIHVLQLILGGFYTITSAAGLVSYGFPIILLTILIKVVTYPLTVKQIKSMKAMQEIQPKMKKIQEKYKNNPQMLQQKTGELFREAGVNPLAGCLPLLVQMPILMGMYYALFNFTFPSAEAAAFFWLPNMSEPDPLYILPILMAGTMFLQTHLNPKPADPVQAKMMTFMPLIFSVMFFFFPSGLVLYWVVSNIFSIAQQWVITRQIEGKPIFGRAA